MNLYQYLQFQIKTTGFILVFSLSKFVKRASLTTTTGSCYSWHIFSLDHTPGLCPVPRCSRCPLGWTPSSPQMRFLFPPQKPQVTALLTSRRVWPSGQATGSDSLARLLPCGVVRAQKLAWKPSVAFALFAF